VSRAQAWLRWASRVLLAVLVLPPALFALYRVLPPPVTPLMVIRWVQGHRIDYQWVPRTEMAPSLARAAIAAEDNLFCRHWGFDVTALREQLTSALSGGRPRGASTISMQTTKNLLLWPGRDPTRKLLEAWLTPQLELLVGKGRILELYLNIVELGPGIYGVEAAARHWFGKPAARLTSEEAARLIAILPAPLAREPRRATNSARRIQRRIGQLGPLLDCADTA
jgi:monofunctional biosynthetic peptidoglycan transglycosylase